MLLLQLPFTLGLAVFEVFIHLHGGMVNVVCIIVAA